MRAGRPAFMHSGCILRTRSSVSAVLSTCTRWSGLEPDRVAEPALDTGSRCRSRSLERESDDAAREGTDHRRYVPRVWAGVSAHRFSCSTVTRDARHGPVSSDDSENGLRAWIRGALRARLITDRTSGPTQSSSLHPGLMLIRKTARWACLRMMDSRETRRAGFVSYQPRVESRGRGNRLVPGIEDPPTGVAATPPPAFANAKRS